MRPLTVNTMFTGPLCAVRIRIGLCLLALIRAHRRYLAVLLGPFTRTLRFALIGLLCFGAQYGAAWLFVRAGIPWPAANAAAFFLSAQLNFVLSSTFTWRDRDVAGRRWSLRRWISYNGTVLLSLAVNTAAFVALYPVTGTLVGSAAGVVAGAGATYLICNYIVFRSRRADPAPAAVALPVERVQPERRIAA
jgi:putative flippase GtrA